MRSYYNLNVVCMYVGVHACVSRVCIMFVVGAYVLISMGQAANRFTNHYPDKCLTMDTFNICLQ